MNDHGQFTRTQWYVLDRIFRLAKHKLGCMGALMWIAEYSRAGAMLLMDVRG